jgi:hypothetical protein
MEKILFKSHKINSNRRAPRKNEVDTHGAPVLAPDYTVSLFWQPNCVLTPMSILCILDFFGYWPY